MVCDGINLLWTAVKANPVEAYSELVIAVTANPMEAESESNDVIESRASLSLCPGRSTVIDVLALSATDRDDISRAAARAGDAQAAESDDLDQPNLSDSECEDGIHHSTKRLGEKPNKS